MVKSGRKELNQGPVAKKASSDMPSPGFAIGLMCMINSLASEESGANSDAQATSEARGDRCLVDRPEPTKSADINPTPPCKKTADGEDDIEVVNCNFEDDRSTAVGDWDETTSRFSDVDAALSDTDDADDYSGVDASIKQDDAPSCEDVERENINVDNWRSVADSLACVFENIQAEEDDDEGVEEETVDPEMWRNVAARMASVFSEE